MTITYNFDFFNTRTEQLFNGRVAAKLIVCLVKNIHNNSNQPMRRYRIADVTGLNAHSLSIGLDLLLKTGIVLRVEIDGPSKLGYRLNMDDDACQLLARFVQVFEGRMQETPALIGGGGGRRNIF